MLRKAVQRLRATKKENEESGGGNISPLFLKKEIKYDFKSIDIRH